MAESPAGPSTIPIIRVSSEPVADDDDASSTTSSSPSEAHTALSQLDKSPDTPPRPSVALDEIHDTKQKSTDGTDGDITLSSRNSPPKPGGYRGIRVTRPQSEHTGPGNTKRSKTGKVCFTAPPAPVDDKTSWHGMVLDHGPVNLNQEVSKVVAFPSKMVFTPPNIPYNNKSFAFQKCLSYADFAASGFLFIRVNGEKETKNVKDNVYVFVVLEGAVEATIHKTSYAISAGGVFLVPRGNDYSIRNISDKDAKLFFTQARKEESPLRLNRPSTKTLLLADWLLQRLVARLLTLRAQAFDWYWRHLARYRHLFQGRRLYFLFFLLGLMVRRLPFIGSPPILNIQLIRFR
ncbi:putative mif2/CENP-C like [Lyophyllum shimeji]|uniref:CENP-C homolog n=1 Tax=Lyophyllum shimeji TaxID=47721 RepID=A0A9P3PFJ1_LYOSH|nr:putative mif2/CENP-C like [Lyophyllum shimeji]